MKSAPRKKSLTGCATLAGFILAASALSLPAAPGKGSVIALPQVIMPAIPDGSNASRAPLPSARPFQYNRYVTPDGKTSVITVVHKGAAALSRSYAVVPPAGTGYARVVETSTAAEVNSIAAAAGAAAPSPVGTVRGAPLVEGSSATAALDAATMVSAIEAESIASRDSLLDEIARRVNASARSLSASGRTPSSLHATARASLDASVLAARNASSDTWPAARSDLARAYAAYAAALAGQ